MAVSTSTMPRIEIMDGTVQGKKTEVKACMFLFKKGYNGDDIFDRQGNYLGRTDEGNFLIRILITDANFEEAAEDVNTNTQLLTQFRYCTEDKINREALLKIVNYYGKKANLDQQVQLGDVDTAKEILNKDGFAFWNRKEKSFNFFIDIQTGKINPESDNYNNIIVALAHEKIHKDDSKTANPLFHVDVIIAEGKHKNYPYTTDQFKMAKGTYAAQLLNDALYPPSSTKGASLKDVLEKIDQFNSSIVGERSVLTYNVETKRVDATLILEEIIIKN